MKTKIIFLCIIIVLSLLIGSYTIEGFATKTITNTQKTEIVKTITTIKDKQHKTDYSNAITPLKI